MNRFLTRALATGLAFCGMATLTAGSLAAAATVDEQPVLQADRAFVLAISKSDAEAAGKFLDTQFTWTDAAGKAETRAQVLRALPTPIIADATEDQAQRHFNYGTLEVIEADSGKAHVLRIWVKRSAGWREFLYQEVKSLDEPLSFTPGAGKTCDNPCKTVQFTPKNEEEKGAITGYMGLESSAVNHDAAGWDAHTAAEFIAASSNSDKLLDKATRLAALRSSKMEGLAPTPLISARMFDFPNAVIMISMHKPDRGDLLHITRLLVNRDGKWVEALSYQTAVQRAAATARK